jgi:hypothetical protein
MRFDPSKDFVTVSFTIKPKRGSFIVYFRYHLNGSYWRSSAWPASSYREAKAIVQKVLVTHWQFLETADELGPNGICDDCRDPAGCKYRGCPRRRHHGTSEQLGVFEVEFTGES